MVKMNESAGQAVSATSTFAVTDESAQFVPCAQRVSCAQDMVGRISALAEILVERVPSTSQEIVVVEIAGRIAQLANLVLSLLGDDAETLESLSDILGGMYPGNGRRVVQ